MRPVDAASGSVATTSVGLLGPMMATIEHSHRSGNNVVGDGYVPDRLLQKAVEQQPGLGRASAVEPELELVQVVLKVGHRRGTLRGGLQPALRLRLNAGHGREQDVRRVRCSLGGNERQRPPDTPEPNSRQPPCLTR